MGDPDEDPIDPGFDDVLAGNVYTHDAAVVTATVIPAAGAAGSLPVASGESEPAVMPVYPAAGLTPEGVQAAKALVKLPQLDFPALAKLAREIAMDIRERTVILQEFKLDNAQYEFLEAYNEFYQHALKTACTEWHAPLSTQERIKVEAAAILEDSLLSLGGRMQNKGEGLPGVVEAAKLFAKIAGVGEREVGSTAPGERFTINIDLGGDQKIVVASSPPPQISAGTTGVGAISEDV